MSKDRFYITTPIYYANDVPHIGHTGTTLYADIIARYNRFLEKDVFFLTGTDEHGEKVALSAEKAGKEPQAFVDELGDKWEEYWKTLNISNDHFIRTTMEGHIKVAQDLLTQLYEKGDIYKDTYKGIYCVGCEEFKSEKDLVDGKCPEHRPDQIEYKEEENYFFRITKYLPTVKKYLEDQTLPVDPENKRNEMIARLDDDLQDLSISRQNVEWGIKIPWDESQTTYVWVEALMNYYSATKIWNKEEFWPASVHFLGKGNNWFHTVIWPSLLLALELPLPERIFVHGYYNVEGKKMGKSLGNVISPQDLMDQYGIDGARYLLAASMPYADDSDVNFDWFTDRYNSALANGLGNLVSRVAKLAEGQEYEIEAFDKSFPELLEAHIEIKDAYENYKLHEVCNEIEKLIADANEYLSNETPWKLDGDEREKVLNNAIEKIVEIARLLRPIIPGRSEAVLNLFSREVSTIKPLFDRV